MARVSMASTSSPSRMARMMTHSGTANDTSGVPHSTRVPICSSTQTDRGTEKVSEVLRHCRPVHRLTQSFLPPSHRGGALGQRGRLDAVRHGRDYEGHGGVEDVGVVLPLKDKENV